MRAKAKRKSGLRLSGGKRDVYGWFFVSPFILGLVVYFGWIYINSFLYSFRSIAIETIGMTYEYVGLENYKYALMVDPDFIKSLLTNIGGILVQIPLILIFSLFVSTLLNQKMHGRGLFRAIFFLPVILATGIVEKSEISNLFASTAMNDGSTAFALFDFEKMLLELNIPVTITTYITGAIDNIFGIVNKSGIQILIFLAGLQSISPSLYESASIEGATPWESFWKITIPMLAPMIFVNTIYSTIDSFVSADNTIMNLIDQTAFTSSKYGVASAMSWLYFLIVLLLIGLLALIFYRTAFRDAKRRS